MHPQRVAVRAWPPRAEAPGLLWLTRDDALAAALPAPIRKLLRRLLVSDGACDAACASGSDRYFSGGRQSRRSGGSSFS